MAMTLIVSSARQSGGRFGQQTTYLINTMVGFVNKIIITQTTGTLECEIMVVKKMYMYNNNNIIIRSDRLIIIKLLFSHNYTALLDLTYTSVLKNKIICQQIIEIMKINFKC